LPGFILLDYRGVSPNTGLRLTSLSAVAPAHSARTVLIVLPLLGVVGLLTACETPAERQAARNAEISRKAAAEVKHICALPENQREAELTRIKDQSGMVIHCGN
jgi:hypothetical protein